MSERNDIEVIVVPEVPKVLSDEEIYVYIPTATNDKKGIASYDDTHFNVVNGEVSVKEEYFKGLRDANIEEHNQDEAAHPFIQSKVEKGLQNVNDALTAGLQELEDAYEANVAKAEKDLVDHNVSPTAHENRFALKFDISNVMSSFTGEDVNNTAKVASAKALKEVVDKINQDLVDAINTVNSDISDTNDVVDITLKNIEYNSTTGVMTFTKVNNQTITVDLPAEKILKDGASYYDVNTRTLHLILMDNSDISIDVYDLVGEYYGDDITIESFEEDGVKLFKIADAYKQTLDGYGTTIEKHEEELYTNIPADLETKIPKTDIVDNLVTDDSTKVLSAKQAKQLKSLIDSQQVNINDSIKSASYDNSTGNLTFTKIDGDTFNVSLPMESFVESASFDETTSTITLNVKNGQPISFSVAALIDYYYGDDVTTEVYSDTDGKKKIRVKSNYLDAVNAEIDTIQEQATILKSRVDALQNIGEFGSIGTADGITITMATDGDERGLLRARKLKLADGTIFDVVITTYDNWAKADNTFYFITDKGALAFGSHLFNAVFDTETTDSITFRQITSTGYDGLANKEQKIYFITNDDGNLTIAYGSNTLPFANYVKFNDYASGSKAGVGLSSSTYGVFRNTDNNYWQIKTASNEEIAAKTNTYKPITPSNIDIAVKTGVATNTIALTDTEKTAAQNWIGIDKVKEELNAKNTEQDSAIALKEDKSKLKALAYKDSLGKADVGLGNVTNDAQVKRTEMGANNGVATLGADGKVPATQLPSYVDDVLEYASYSAFPITGETGKIYVSLDNNRTYRWGGTTYVEISESLALGETSGTAYAGEKGKANADAIAALQSRASTIEGQIGSINTKDSAQDEAITALQTKNSEQDTAISNAQSTANSKANKSTTVNATLSASSWQGSSAPYTYTLSVNGVTATSNQEILEALNITATQLEALQAANIVDGGQSANSITLKAFGEKPTIDIPIRVILRGD